ncbi:MAG: hypothetical protein QMD13_00075 [Candidatus Bathyarchaeia archaeon]|nr:hypothetical protein [Candidatus Bathyarchaeia archaeon]
MKKIDRKTRTEDFLSINVAEIKCFREGHENYRSAWREYKGFEIDYGVEKLSPFEQATLEDHEFGKLYFVGFEDEMKGFREDTNRNFEEMAKKYGDISKELNEFRKTKGFLKCFYFRVQKKRSKIT